MAKNNRAKPSKRVEKKRESKSSDALLKQRNNKATIGSTAIDSDEPTATSKKKPAQFPVVGVGASAGGFEAFRLLFEHIPPDTGMAFVLISHLAPNHESLLSELLSRYVAMPIEEVQHGRIVQPNHVYVIPQNTDMTMKGGSLCLSERRNQEVHMPIDVFFRSLASEVESKAVGVVLSGTGSDGALGIAAIKEAGGLTFSQDERSAKFNSMPRSAIATGCVDRVLPPSEIGQELKRIGNHPFIAQPVDSETNRVFDEDEEHLNRIFVLLRFSSGLDFSHYKQTTIRRRIGRRMALHRIEKLEEYFKYLQGRPEEAESLHRELLISVTNFFRDPGSFEILKKKVLPLITKNRSPEEPIRIWIAGCSTGEEVYSMAIILLEYLSERGLHFPVQIFATDVNDHVLQRARTGHYIENIIQDVSKERLHRFFQKTDRGYEINKSIRDLCIFAKQDITKDPPFSRIDIINCRNVLIYMGSALQKKVLPIFHYALRPKGFLVLGNSETIGGFSELFTVVDKKEKIFSKKDIPARMQVTFSAGSIHSEEPIRAETAGRHQRGLTATRNELDIQREADRIVLNQYSPAAVLVNEHLEIVQFRGDVSSFLTLASGKASFQLLKMAREGLLVDLRTSINHAKRNGTVVIREGIIVHGHDRKRNVSLKVVPLKQPQSSARFFLVLFEEMPMEIPALKGKAKRDKEALVSAKVQRELEQLKIELLSTREYLQSIIEEQEATNEELKSANEEILSSNEELQSTNEELETAKEELQSTNEELQTVNEEVQNRNTELTTVNNDLTNLLALVNLPILMLGNDLRVRRFTPMAEKLLNLIPTDIGRLISDININLRMNDLDRLVSKAIDEVAVQEKEVQDKEGHWYLLRIRPYKTPENKIEGAVIVLIGQDEMRGTRHELQFIRNYADTVMEITRDPMVLLDPTWTIKSVNTAFLKSFKLNNVDAVNHNFYQILGGAWDDHEIRARLTALHSKMEGSDSFETGIKLPDGSKRHLMLNSRLVNFGNDGEVQVLISLEEFGAQLAVEQELREKNRVLLQEVHHRVKNNLQIVSSLLNMQSRYTDDKDVQHVFLESDNRIRSMALIHEKLYQSQDLTRIHFADYAQSLISHLASSYGSHADHVRVSLEAEKGIMLGLDDAVPCGLLITELVTNAIRHAFPSDFTAKEGKPEIHVGIKADDKITLTVSDNGKGLPKEVDVDTAGSMGLRLVRMLASQLNGNVQMRTNGGTDWKITFKNSLPPT